MEVGGGLLRLNWQGRGGFHSEMERGSGGTLDALTSTLRLQNHQVPALTLVTGFAGRYSDYFNPSEPQFLLPQDWAFGQAHFGGPHTHGHLWL